MVLINYRKISVVQLIVYRERKVPIQQVEYDDCGEKEHLPTIALNFSVSKLELLFFSI